MLLFFPTTKQANLSQPFQQKKCVFFLAVLQLGWFGFENCLPQEVQRWTRLCWLVGCGILATHASSLLKTSHFVWFTLHLQAIWSTNMICCMSYMGVSLNGGTPISHPNMIIFSSKTNGPVEETHHFRKPPYILDLHRSGQIIATSHDLTPKFKR